MIWGNLNEQPGYLFTRGADSMRVAPPSIHEEPVSLIRMLVSLSGQSIF